MGTRERSGSLLGGMYLSGGIISFHYTPENKQQKKKALRLRRTIFLVFIQF